MVRITTASTVLIYQRNEEIGMCMCMCMYMSVGFHTYTCDPSETKPRATGKDRGMWEGTREGYVGTTQGSLGTLPWEKTLFHFCLFGLTVA